MASYRTRGTILFKVSGGLRVRFTDDEGHSRDETFSTADAYSYEEGGTVTVVKGRWGSWDLAGAYDVDEDFREKFRDKG